MFYVVYFIFYILSKLPWGILFLISDIFYLFLYSIFRYRREVVRTNLNLVFKDKNLADIIKIEKQFYKNFTDYFFETIKYLTISEADIEKRITNLWQKDLLFTKPEQPTIILQGHFMNWELISLVLGKHIQPPVISVYKHISSGIIQKIMLRLRSKRGLKLVNTDHFMKEFLPFRKLNFSLVLVADQNPINPEKSLWIPFFDVPIPFTDGPEQLAKMTKARVVYFAIKKLGRGKYQTSFELITNDISEYKKGDLMIKYKELVEKYILEQPENYLWSHNRFKYKFEDFQAKAGVEICGDSKNEGVKKVNQERM
ncbi:MAG: lysophospholipid acyltransferase family protein [Alphaproteobacteria bacterium]|nr:lysophospholipid acyltransferase family protein [Alphaproteobacteria bacterium]